MAEELRELRLSKQIPAKDMVAVVQAIYPKYDKTVQSKCENGDAYGVSLRELTMFAEQTYRQKDGMDRADEVVGAAGVDDRADDALVVGQALLSLVA